MIECKELHCSHDDDDDDKFCGSSPVGQNNKAHN